MADPRIEKLAKLCVRYSVSVKKNEKVWIWADPFALPLVSARGAKQKTEQVEAFLKVGFDPVCQTDNHIFLRKPS